MKASLPSYCCRCVACYFYKHSPSYFFLFLLNETCYMARKFDGAGAGGGASSDVIALKSEEEARAGKWEKERETRRRQICVTEWLEIAPISARDQEGHAWPVCDCNLSWTELNWFLWVPTLSWPTCSDGFDGGNRWDWSSSQFSQSRDRK